MPTYLRPDDKPVVQFDPTLEISPFLLFRQLREGSGPRLVDVRTNPTEVTLRDARPWPGEEWTPDGDERIVLFDDDGSEAEAVVRRLQAAGHENVRMLFGGLELYRFSLDPQVVGEETFIDPL